MALLVIFTCFTTFQRDLIRKNRDGLILFLVTLVFAAYLSMGGAIFKIIEGPQEDNVAALKILGNLKTRYPSITDEAINDLFHQLSATGIKGLPDGNQKPKWTFGNAFLYSITLLTTIGYGHLSPLTAVGKIVTMVYTAVGIPVTLCVMSLYVCRLMSIAASYKASLFRKLKGPLTPVQINFIHISTIMTLILFGCFLIPAVIFDALEDSWNFLDSLYYCFISLTTVGLGDYVPGQDTQSELYRIGSGIYILFGVIVMMFMLALSSDFYKHCYEEVTLPVTIHHTEEVSIHKSKLPSYGAVGLLQSVNEEYLRAIPEEQQRLLQP
ncbi:potassium channel subfamily K member 6 [Parasteatoda tepidariorum]|uniref:Potassium channel subfamily K member 6 n=1 Tax=Parasteatoda tepidariorum TaxID=114398 RepID=A0A2L2XYJ6_PARTP|nr:potassium channel subfamily K member 6 [Parasteatoda tepidariorum]